MPGRQISDSIMLAHEMIHTTNKKRKSKQYYLALKVDIAKAYDCLEWNFVKMALQKFNFHPWLINLIYSCISTASFKVKDNNDVSETWYPGRGLRQGDPL